jgi:hypothetical protein
LSAEGLKLFEVAQGIAGSLKEQHRNVDVEEVLASRTRRATSRVQRETEED